MDYIEKNLPLVWGVIHKKFKGGEDLAKQHGLEQEDLYHYGVIGLIKAMDNFDPERGLAFSTYAVPMIEGEILRFVRDSNPVIRFSRPIKSIAYRMLRLHIDKIEIEDIMKHENISKERAEQVLHFISHYKVGMSEVVFEDDGESITYEDMLESDEDLEEDVLYELEIEEALSILSEKERLVCELLAWRGLTQKEVGKMIGVTQVQVSRIFNGALDKIKEHRKLREFTKENELELCV